VGPGDAAPDEVARRLAKVYQTGIPRIVEGFVHDDRAVLVAQAYEGITLEARLERGPIAVTDALDLAKAIGAALAKLHAQGFVHGHVDERAIFLHEDGRTLLLHTGMAPFLAPRSPRAPEDLRAAPCESSDVFGMARVLARLVIGEDPLARADPSDEREALAHGAPLRPDELPRELPEGLRRFLARATHPDPAERIRRAEEFAGDLRVLRASWDSITQRPEKPLPFPKLPRELAIGALVAVVAAALLLARGCASRAGFPG
jgi:serine/threonine protein kinase